MGEKRMNRADRLAVAAAFMFLGHGVSAGDVERGYAPVNGLEMYYEIHGTGDRTETPLVLLHGGCSTIDASFGSVLPILAMSRRVVAVEQQGHGHTADVDRPFSFEQSADDTAALLRRLKIEKADFFGYSNGGTIALHIALRHPQRVRKLVLASSIYKREGLPSWAWDGIRKATTSAGMPAELREAYARTSPHPERLQSFHEKCRNRMLSFQDMSPSQLRAVAAPVLVMVGDDGDVAVEHAAEMRRLLPHARLAVLPGTDHMTMPKRGAWQASMIEPFLDELWGER